MGDSQPQIRTLPTRTARTRPDYQEYDTESGTDDEASSSRQYSRRQNSNRRTQARPKVDSVTQRTSSRPSRSTRRIQDYRENSGTDQDDTISILSSNSEAVITSRTTTLRSSKPALTTTASTFRKRSRNSSHQTRQRSAFDNHKRRKLGQPRPLNKRIEGLTYTVKIPNNGIYPPWQTLPYILLVKIMQYASYPLHTSTGIRSPSTQWLINTSKLCKSFHDAASTALFRCPPLLPAEHAKELIRMLSSDQSSLMLNYSQRVRTLHVEVRDLLVRKSGVCLEQLIRCSPLLKELRIFHTHDRLIGKFLWADPVYTRQKWSYGGIFDILSEMNIRLEVFEWNGRFQDTIAKMSQAHTMSCMQTLKDLTILNITFEEKREADRIVAREQMIEALRLCPDLRRLTIQHCNIIDDVAMAHLPSELTSLTISNCLSLASDGLEKYLQYSGRSLTELHLAGNQVMSLGFMSNLKDACPNLEQLNIDLNYDDCTSYNDREPLFDDLLPNGRPTWPTKLHSIMIGPLRCLSIDDAEGFFISLIESAGSFKYLRMLSLKTLLTDAGWRERAQLRSKWVPLIEKVFLARKSTQSKLVNSKRPAEVIASPGQPSRKSARLLELEETSVSESADDYEDNIPPPFTAPLPRQNGCFVVEFELSDQRPAKDQFTEQDFMDDEIDGDGTYG